MPSFSSLSNTSKAREGGTWSRSLGLTLSVFLNHRFSHHSINQNVTFTFAEQAEWGFCTVTPAVSELSWPNLTESNFHAAFDFCPCFLYLLFTRGALPNMLSSSTAHLHKRVHCCKGGKKCVAVIQAIFVFLQSA